MPRGKDPKSLANLKPPIKAGEVRNPFGVNRKRPWTERYTVTSATALPEPLRVKFNADLGCEVLQPGATFSDAAIMRRHLEAMGIGGTSAAKEIADRIEGKSTAQSGPSRMAHLFQLRGEPCREDGRTTEQQVRQYCTA